MYLGIDVGGTHTDAVALEGGKVVCSCKVPTDHDDLLVSIRGALEKVLADIDGKSIKRLNLSTTLSTNAIVEGKTESVGVLVSSGPGIDPEYFRIGRNYYMLPGSIDHRGEEVSPLGSDALQDALAECKEQGVRVFAAVSKFSTRNPAHELAMKQAIGNDADFVTLGHRMSGLLNFPRRISTAYYNAAVWRTYNAFADAVEQSLKDYGLASIPSVNVLKADGGTMPLELSRQVPVESILSGPAASVMGVIALCDVSQDAVILDIGGTTTDIAIFASGSPLIENRGIEVGSYPTLVRALKTRSIGIGGDSRLHVVEGRVYVGPEREGPAMALGGQRATLIDVCNYLGHSEIGDVQASRQGMEQLASLWDIAADKLAADALEYAIQTIKKAVDDLIWELNARPVYTIHELLAGHVLKPTRVYCMGGPAKTLQSFLARAFELDVEVPENFAVANAVGAALTRTTMELELFADTFKRRMLIPQLGVEQEIPKSYTLEQAELEVRTRLKDYLAEVQAGDYDLDQLDLIEGSSFNMVDYYRGTGRNIRVKCQLQPGIDD